MNVRFNSSERRDIRPAALLCTFALAMLVLFFGAGSQEAQATTASEPQGSNGLTLSTIADADGDPGFVAVTPQADSSVLQSEAEVVSALRAGMVQRKATIQMDVSVAAYRSMNVSTLIQKAFEETGQCNEGDYLRFAIKAGSSGQSSISVSTVFKSGIATVSFNVLYNTSAAQEAIALQRLNSTYATISSNWTSSTSNLQKARDIHDWICKNVTYDKNYALPSYSMYGALVNHRAVCQGYSSLFYALAKRAGLPVRIIGGIGVQGKNIEDHAWNIVSLDGGKTYHNIDTTWDSSFYHSGGNWRTYFLNNDNSFTKSHVRGAYGVPYENYASEPFVSEHPMVTTYVAATPATCTQAALKEHWRGANSSTTYRDPTGKSSIGSNELKTGSALGHSWSAWKTTKAATYTAAGTRSHTCSRCGKTETQSIAKLVATKIATPGAARNLRYTGRQLTGVAANARYTISGNKATKVGTYYATVKPKTGYVWSNGSSAAVKVKWTIAKANNPMTAAPAAKVLKASRSRATTFATGKAFRVTKSQGAVRYAKTSGTGYVTVASNGKVTVKKGARKGTYTVRVRVTAKGNASYNAVNKYVNLKITVV